MKTYDLSFLRSHCADNPEFMDEMIEMILTETPFYIREIRNNLQNQDWNSLHQNVHKIRPSMEFIGMRKEISEAANLLEQHARKLENLEEIPALFEKIEAEFQAVFLELKDELPSSN